MKGPIFGCVIFHTSENHVPEGMNPLLLSMSVEREIKQRLMNQWNCREFIYMGNTLLILELDAGKRSSFLQGFIRNKTGN